MTKGTLEMEKQANVWVISTHKKSDVCQKSDSTKEIIVFYSQF